LPITFRDGVGAHAHCRFSFRFLLTKDHDDNHQRKLDYGWNRKKWQRGRQGGRIAVKGNSIYGQWWNWFYCNYPDPTKIPLDNSCPPDKRLPNGYRFLISDNVGKLSTSCGIDKANTRKCTIRKGEKVVVPIVNFNYVTDFKTEACDCDKDTSATVARVVRMTANKFKQLSARVGRKGSTRRAQSARYFASELYEVDYDVPSDCPNGWDPLGVGGLKNFQALHDGYWMKTMHFKETGTFIIETVGQNDDDGSCYATKYEIVVK